MFKYKDFWVLYYYKIEVFFQELWLGQQNQGLSKMIVSALQTGSVWDYSPKISKIRPTVADIPKLLGDVKYTSFDVINMVFQQSVPEYTNSSLAPPIPKPNATFTYQPISVQPLNVSIPSATSILMNKAMAIKAYQRVN